MMGPPKDVDGQCNARLFIGDDFGDNHATMRCGLNPGHGGPHQEKCVRFRIVWYADERPLELPAEDPPSDDVDSQATTRWLNEMAQAEDEAGQPLAGAPPKRATWWRRMVEMFDQAVHRIAGG